LISLVDDIDNGNGELVTFSEPEILTDPNLSFSDEDFLNHRKSDDPRTKAVQKVVDEIDSTDGEFENEFSVPEQVATFIEIDKQTGGNNANDETFKKLIEALKGWEAIEG